MYSIYMSFSTRNIFISLLFILLFVCLPGKAHAKAFIDASDTLSTTRPSAIGDIAASATSSATQIIITDTNAIFLASDAAQLQSSSGTILGTSAISYLSGKDTPASGQRTIYLTTPFNVDTSPTDNFLVPVPAMHTFEFTTQTSIPAGGNIVLTFPGSANNNSYPSQGSFAFNSLSASNIKFNNATCGTITVSSPTITCDSVSSTIAAGTKITIFVGCSAASGAACTTQAPTLLNPLKTLNGGDIHKIKIATQNTSDSELDASYITATTGSSVTISGTVEARFTFSLGGVSNATAVNDTNPGCTLSETTNAGLNARARSLSLGEIKYTPNQKDTKISNITAQLLGVSTNSLNGYVLFASSDSPLTQVGGSATFTTSTSPDSPESFPSGKNYFGLHACGADTPASTWTETGDQNCSTMISGSTANECKYAWPKSGDDIILSADYIGPIGMGQIEGNGLTSVSYAAGIDGLIVPGDYSSVITYTALPTF